MCGAIKFTELTEKSYGDNTNREENPRSMPWDVNTQGSHKGTFVHETVQQKNVRCYRSQRKRKVYREGSPLYGI